MTHLRLTVRATSQSGFALVVIAALFIAFSVIAAVAVERNTTVQLINRRDATAEQLTRLSNAIIEYSVFNKQGTINRYPCPASTGIAPNDVSGDFGKVTTACDTGALPAGTVGLPTNLAADKLIRGMVPVLTLSQYGVGINDAFDPWNNRIIYIVNRDLTSGVAAPSLANQTNNATITDNGTGLATVSPDFILISYGRDGVGGIKRTVTTASITCPAASTVLREENCDGDSTFITGPTYTASNATGANYFDDILTYYRQ